MLFGASAASVRLADATVADEPDAAVVGDISLRYVYPAYTGLEPRSVPNSDGTIIALPGTAVTVRARTATAFQAVAIEVDGMEPVDGTLRGGRDAECGVRGGQRAVAIFAIRRGPGNDQSVVRADGGCGRATRGGVVQEREIKAPMDTPLGVGWQVTDDYGVVRVSLEVVRERGHRARASRAAQPPGKPRRHRVDDPASLGLSAGDVVSVRVVAVDNDRVEGGNRGESEALTVTVLGPVAMGVTSRLTTNDCWTPC